MDISEGYSSLEHDNTCFEAFCGNQSLSMCPKITSGCTELLSRKSKVHPEHFLLRLLSKVRKKGSLEWMVCGLESNTFCVLLEGVACEVVPGILLEGEVSNCSSKGRVEVACELLEEVLWTLLEGEVNDCSSKGRVKLAYDDKKEGRGVVPARVVKEEHFCG